jgi:S-DNA-T family DNA segregation ATPase FtsK/SpoIIIE
MILNREKDLALALASPNLRFEPVVPGESVVGIEVPNTRPTPVTVRSVMETREWQVFERQAQVPVPLGLGSGGEPVFADLARMPHTLIAGATGSGKSVCMNTVITGLLMSRTPAQVRMVMVDPKRVELTPYAGIPHLYTPVVVEADRAVATLKALIAEMMGRFRVLEQAGVKNIVGFNDKSPTKMPYLVILVDELADLMLQAANEVERLLVRLAQLGRATGVHLVVATQRPSVDVVTGLIKANFPSRISFAVMSQIDSRTVLDATGGEKLLGRGDMLYLPIDKAKPQRVQGAFLSDSEIESVVSAWKRVKGPEMPQLEVELEDQALVDAGFEAESDSLTDRAIGLARTQKTLSTSLLQRRLRIGYPRAARLMDELEDAGIVGPGEPGKPRQVLGV